MESLEKHFDKVPYSRVLLVILLGICLIVVHLYLRTSVGERAVVNFQNEIDQRIARVAQSIDSLPVVDPQLLTCISIAASDRAKIHPLNSGGIDDVRELGILYCRNQGITDLSGIGELSSLRFLDVSRNSIRSLAPLRGHPALKTLHIGDNPLQGIGELRTLPLLQEVYLPNLPEETCVDVEGLLRDKRSNFKTIECYGPKPGQANTTANPASVNARKPATGKKQLSDSQHRELVEYEQEMRYQKR